MEIERLFKQIRESVSPFMGVEASKKRLLEKGFLDWIAVFSENAFPEGIVTVSNIRKGKGNIRSKRPKSSGSYSACARASTCGNQL